MSAKCYWQGTLYLKQCVLSSYPLPFWWSCCLTQHAHIFIPCATCHSLTLPFCAQDEEALSDIQGVAGEGWLYIW